MRSYLDMSFKEIADETGVSINTALGRMRYALINLKKKMKENNRTEREKSAFYFVGWMCAAAQHRAMNQVVEKYGWEGLNAENLKAALNTIKDWKPFGGMANVTYTAKRPVPRGVRMCQVKGGKILPITGWKVSPNFLPE